MFYEIDNYIITLKYKFVLYLSFTKRVVFQLYILKTNNMYLKKLVKKENTIYKIYTFNKAYIISYER